MDRLDMTSQSERGICRDRGPWKVLQCRIVNAKARTIFHFHLRPRFGGAEKASNTLLLSRVYEQKLAAGDLEAVKVLKSTSPVVWRDVNLIGKFDFTTSSTPVDIEALAARYQNEDFWRLSMQEGDEESPEQ